MIKKIFFSSILFSFFAAGVAAPLSPEEALSRVNIKQLRLQTQTSVTPQLSMTVTSQSGDNALYVFERPGNNGFLILSADDSVLPVLGYADAGGFDAENISPSFKSWLEEYARQIEFVKTHNLKSSSGIATDEREPIAPLISTKWDQGTPYNEMCPTVKKQKAPTGCAATVMAQVMNYYKYPERGNGEINYYSAGDVNDYLSLDFSAQPFDWENMLESYTNGYSQAQADAVAYLMKACGYAAQMKYSLSGSGAMSYNMCIGLVNYFGYDKSINILQRNSYSLDEWTQIIYDNLAMAHPVIYSGFGAFGGGHTFACDGYEDGYFHFNWGWSGSNDGYFLLDVLDPYDHGIGGNSSGFSFFENAIINIKPAASDDSAIPMPLITQSGTLFGKIEAEILSLGLYRTSKFNYGWHNFGHLAHTFTLGIKIEDVQKDSTPIYINSLNVNNETFAPYEGWGDENDQQGSVLKFNLNGMDLSAGRYKVTLGYNTLDMPEYGWLPVLPDYGFPNYLYLISDGKTFSIEDVVSAELEIKDFKLLSPLYPTVTDKCSITIYNPNDIQLTKSIGMHVRDTNGNSLFVSDYFMITVNPGETKTIEWPFELNPLTNDNYRKPTPVEIYLFDYAYVTYYDIEPLKTSVTPYRTDMAAYCSYTLENGLEIDGNWKVNDADPLSIDVNIYMVRGVCYGSLCFNVERTRDGKTVKYYEQYIDDIPFIFEGENKSFNYQVSIKDNEPDDVYTLYMSYADYETEVYTKLEGDCSFTIGKYDASVGIIVDNSDIKILYDPNLRQIGINAMSGLKSVSVSGIDGSKKFEIQPDGNNYFELSTDLFANGLVIVSVIDQSGYVKTQKIMIR